MHENNKLDKDQLLLNIKKGKEISIIENAKELNNQEG